jgi:hypothetical protein
MKPESGGLPQDADAELRELPKWARRYAQNRTLPVLVFLLIFAAGYVAFGGLSYLTAWAYRADRRILAASAMLVLSGFAVWWMWFSFVGGPAIMRRVAERLYQREGSVIAGTSQAEEHKRLPLGVFIFMFCVVASVGLGLLGFYPIGLMQPVSALYVVPFFCYLGLKLRRVGSPFMFLWPALYGIHAVLIVAGAPIGVGPAFDIFVPVVGYGILAALAGHLYSRVALRRLRAIAASRNAADPRETESR